MNELLRFKRAAKSHGICKEWGGAWDAATTREELFNVALSAQGVEYIAASILGGWGLSVGFLTEAFGDYINGNRQRSADGYTSELYAGHRQPVEQRSTLILMVGCECVFHVPKGHACQLYVCGDSSVTVRNDGYCAVYIYGKNKVRCEGNAVHRKEIIST